MYVPQMQKKANISTL